MENPGKRGPLAYAAVIAAVFLLLVISLAVRLNKEKEHIVFNKVLMGTVVEITLMEGDPKRFDAAAKAAFDEIIRLESILSSYKYDSDVSRISSMAGGEPVKVSPEVVEVLEKALHMARLSDGAFDPTIGALARVWGYSGESGKVPSEDEIVKLLPLVNYRDVIVDEKASTVRLARKGMTLNLGGVAKGYIVGKAATALKENGVTRAIIRAGGDMTVFDSTGKARPFLIGIKHPRKDGTLLGEVSVMEGAVATSGDYERFFEKDGIRYHHILDPKTGFPARRSMAVTVAAVDPTLADALSTAVFVLGPAEGMDLIKSIKGAEGLIVDPEGKTTASPGFQGTINPF